MAEILTSETPIREFRTKSVSSVATIQGVQIPSDADGYSIYAPTNAYNLQIAPRLVFCGKTDDAGVTFTDYTGAATDGSAATDVDLDSLNTAANDNYLYVCAHYKFAGMCVDVDDSHPNGTASTLSGYYYNGTDWTTDISVTDGTVGTGATFAVDGNVTWTVPTDWETVDLTIATSSKGVTTVLHGLYIVRFQVSAQLDSDTLLDGITLLSGVTGAVMVAATTYIFGLDREANGALNIDEAGSTSQTIRVNWFSHRIKGV